MGLISSLCKLPGCLDADPVQERPQIPEQEPSQHDSTSRHEEKVRKTLEENGTSETEITLRRRRRKARERRREKRMRDDAQNSAPVRAKKGKKRAKEQHMNALEHERESDIKTSPAVHRKSSKEFKDAFPLRTHTLTPSRSLPPIEVDPRTPSLASEVIESHYPLRLEPLVTRVDPHPSPSMEGRARMRLRKPRMDAENIDNEVPKVRVIHVVPQPSSPERPPERRSERKPRMEVKKMDRRMRKVRVIHVVPHPSPERSMERRIGRKPKKEAKGMESEGEPPAPAPEVVKSHQPLGLEPLVTRVDPHPSPERSMDQWKARKEAESVAHAAPKPKASPSSPERRARRKPREEAENMQREGSSPCVPYECTEVMPLSAASSQSDLILMDIKDDTSEPELQFFSLFEPKHSRPERPEPRENPPTLCWMEEMLEGESQMDEVQPEAPETPENNTRNTDVEPFQGKDDVIDARPSGAAGDGLKDEEKTTTKAFFILQYWLERKTKKQKEKKLRKERKRTQLSSLRERYIYSPALNHLYVNKNNPNFSPVLLL